MKTIESDNSEGAYGVRPPGITYEKFAKMVNKLNRNASTCIYCMLRDSEHNRGDVVEGTHVQSMFLQEILFAFFNDYTNPFDDMILDSIFYAQENKTALVKGISCILSTIAVVCLVHPVLDVYVERTYLWFLTLVK